MDLLLKNNRAQIRRNETYINGFKNAVYWVVKYIDDFEQLKRAVHNSLYKYVEDKPPKSTTVDPDIKREYENQIKYLTNTVNSLAKRLDKETQLHRADNLQIMNVNNVLMENINDLRTKKKQAEQNLKKMVS